MSPVNVAAADVCECVRLTQVAAPRDRRRPSMNSTLAPHIVGHAKGPDEMSDERDRYWFVAGVFREPRDLVATIAALRTGAFAASCLLIVANHRAGDARKALSGSGSGRVSVVAVHADGALESGDAVALPVDLRALLEAMDESGKARGRRDGEDRSQVYAQLRQDVAEGALVLVASAASPDEQLDGARILLRGNCECVLTHEIDVLRM